MRFKGIIIGSARHDENGKYSGGMVGDQTGKEVSTQNFYVSSKGWYIKRTVLIDKNNTWNSTLTSARDILSIKRNLNL